MFKSSWTIGKIYGIPIRLHVSLVFALPFFTWVFGYNVQMLTTTLGIDPQDLALNPFAIGFLLGVGLFFSVGLHELGHSLMALRRGLKIRNITLMLLGGVAQLEDFGDRPSDELAISVMGPIVSLALGLLLLTLRLFVPAIVDLQVFLIYLAQLNLFLAVFNLLPAFPSDGGRVLRAVLAKRQTHLTATRTAVAFGQGFAVLFGIAGLLSGNFFLVLIAFFIYTAATQEYHSGLLKTTLSDFKVRDLMTREVITVSENHSVQQLLETMYEKRHTGYPVVDGDSVVGLVTMEDIRKVNPAERNGKQIRDIMSTELRKVHPNDDITKALQYMSSHHIGRLLVFEWDQLVGIITRTDIIKGFQLRQLEDGSSGPN